MIDTLIYRSTLLVILKALLAFPHHLVRRVLEAGWMSEETSMFFAID